MKKKGLMIVYIFIIGLLINQNVCAISTCGLTLTSNESPSSHVIEGVPHISQSDFIGCHFCAIAMAFQYYGLDVNPFELAYLCGAAHSCLYGLKLFQHPIPLKFPPYINTIYPGEICSEGQADTRFLGSLFGLCCDDWVPPIRISKILCWNQYWNKLKSHILNNEPVITGIDPLAWPLYQKAKNLSRTPLISFGGHSILIVGFNESNQSVCFHDSEAGYYPTIPPEEGTYAWVDIPSFKKAVSRTFWSLWDFSYWILSYEKVTEPLQKDIIYEMANERNIQRMKGIPSSYDYNVCSRNYRYFGINAIKMLKHSLQITQHIIPLYLYYSKENIPIYKFFSRFGLVDLNESTFLTYTRKNNMSAILLNETDLPNKFKVQANLLKQESIYWEKIFEYTKNLDSIMIGKKTIKGIINTQQILNKICFLLDDVITIEKAIILIE